MVNFPILTLIMIAPIIGAVIILLIPKERGDAIKTVAAMSSLASLLLSVVVFFGYDRLALDNAGRNGFPV